MPSSRKRIRVLIADDHPIYRQGLVDMVKRRPDLQLVGQAETGREALDRVRELKPEVVVLDMKMPGLDGMEVTRAIMRDELGTRVLILSGYLESGTIYHALEAGAGGYISKDCEPDAVCDAITAVARGQTVLSQETHGGIAEEIRLHTPAGPVGLSTREREILRMTADGHSASDIASRLYLSPATVKTHLQRIYQKLEVSDRAAAVAEAMRRGIFE